MIALHAAGAQLRAMLLHLRRSICKACRPRPVIKNLVSQGDALPSYWPMPMFGVACATLMESIHYVQREKLPPFIFALARCVTCEGRKDSPRRKVVSIEVIGFGDSTEVGMRDPSYHWKLDEVDSWCLPLQALHAD